MKTDEQINQEQKKPECGGRNPDVPPLFFKDEMLPVKEVLRPALREITLEGSNILADLKYARE